MMHLQIKRTFTLDNLKWYCKQQICPDDFKLVIANNQLVILYALSKVFWSAQNILNHQFNLLYRAWSW